MRAREKRKLSTAYLQPGGGGGVLNKILYGKALYIEI